MKFDNYYACLDLKPTDNREAVKTAFKAAVLKYHPDKNNPEADAGKLEEVLQAWQYLSTGDNLKNYYDSVINGKNIKPTINNTNKDNGFFSVPTKPTFTLGTKAKIPVYIPILIYQTKYEGFYKTESPIGNRVVLAEIFIPNTEGSQGLKLNSQLLNTVTERLNTALSSKNFKDIPQFLQVGVDANEVGYVGGFSGILGQHSHYHLFMAALVLKVSLRVIDLERLSEHEVFGSLNSGKERFLTIRPNTKINVDDIISIQFNISSPRLLLELYDRFPLLLDTIEVKNSEFNIEKNSSENRPEPEIIHQIRAFSHR